MKDDDSYFCYHYRPPPQEEPKTVQPEKPKKIVEQPSTVQKQKRNGPTKKVGESLLETIFKQEMRTEKKRK